MKKLLIVGVVAIGLLFFSGFPYSYQKQEVSALVFTKEVYSKSSSTSMIPVGKMFIPINSSGTRNRVKNSFGVVYENKIQVVKSKNLYDKVEPKDYIDMYYFTIKNKNEKIIMDYLKLK